jgi:hypothetical protein
MKCHNPEFITIKKSRNSERPEERAGFPDTLIDYLSAREIPFSNRDNIRQKLVKTLVEEKGYQKRDISLDREIRFASKAGGTCRHAILWRNTHCL